MEYIGPLLEKEIAEGVAKGDLNPLTKEPNSNELVDPHYKELLNQFNSEESSNNKDIKNEPLKANKLFRPSQFKVTMNYNKSDFLTNALNNGNQKKNNSSLIRLFQKSNENNNNNLPEKPKSYHIQEVVKNNITEISIIDNVDDIANSSDIEININNNYSNEISNINLNESIVIDEILNSSDNENDNSNINQNENIKSNCLNDTSLHNNNNNNNRDNNMDTNDNNDDNNINKNNKKNSSIINNNIDGNISDDNIKNDTPKQKVCSQNINSKSVKPIKNDNSNVKVKIIENFFSKNNSFSKHRSTTKNTTMDTGNPLSNKEKSKENNIKTTSNKNNKNKSKSQSIPNNSISNYFLSNKQKSCSTTPKLNRHTSYPVVKCNNRQELITNYQKKNLKSLFDSLNNNADVVEKQKNIIELKKVFDSSNNNADVVEKQKNIVNNNESSMKNNLTSIMEEKKTLDNGIIIDDIQDSDTEENNPLNIQRVNNSLMQSIVPESSFSNNSIADKTIENIINQNNERASSNLNQNIKNDTKSKLKSLFNRNNILLKKSASVSDISPYFSRKFSDQEVDNIESMNNENNKMIVDEPEPVYISDSENESNNKSNENNEESNVQVCIGQKNNINNDNNNNSSNNKNSNIENESEDKKSNSSNNSNQIHSHSISYLYDDDKGGSFSSNSSFLNIFDTFSKSDNEDDILPEVFEVYPKKADSENKIANTQSSTTQNHSSNNDDTNSDDSNHTNNCCTSTINISQMLNSFNTNSLKRKREDLTNINANSQNRNVMKKESFSEENKQNTSHSEKVNNNQSNKNINLILREKFAYNKNIEIKNKSANQILTQSLMSSLPSYNLNSSVKASKAYVAPKINKKKNIKRKTLSSSSQNKKEKENQKIEENRLETSALRNFLYEKFKYKE
ncbi:hypothetical protein BCR36DRAFT_28256 [Piromyces finnis]|uniref:Uncharacterized protein n=1 Tax=Piromyces finnis TaxID=1754191 RepID=A0A1Y1VDT8_9FUNG|nr:hypothetical protein BCR36DRAFT_28256 [Piromyces finnis]|eukprot:ORX52944.1 hypothetical protein BCR36DRAFT_28256 [Piromyces finnis]